MRELKKKLREHLTIKTEKNMTAIDINIGRSLNYDSKLPMYIGAVIFVFV